MEPREGFQALGDLKMAVLGVAWQSFVELGRMRM